MVLSVAMRAALMVTWRTLVISFLAMTVGSSSASVMAASMILSSLFLFSVLTLIFAIIVSRAVLFLFLTVALSAVRADVCPALCGHFFQTRGDGNRDVEVEGVRF